MDYCGVGLMSVWVNVHLDYCLIGRMLGRANVYRVPVHGLLSVQVTVQSGCCPIRLLSGQTTVFWVSIHQASICRICILGEVSIGLVPGRTLSGYGSIDALLVSCKVCLLFQGNSKTDLEFMIHYYRFRAI